MSQTILLTGITGFIAKAIAAELLNAGYGVRGSLRRLDRVQEVRDAVAPRLTDPASLKRLSFVTLDLMADAGWAAAMEGIDGVIHTASPFPAKIPAQEADLIRPAVDGVMRALRAAEAADVRRVVMTSSTAAIMQRDLPDRTTVTADMWSDLNHVSMTAYARSKTLAERAAWDFAGQHPAMQLTAINPSLVIGTPLDRHYGTSLRLFAQMISGKVPAMPNVGLALVDVADVAQAHVAALGAPDSIGKRILLVSDYVMARDLVTMLRAAAPEGRLPRVVVPKLLARAIGLVSPQVRSLVPLIDKTLSIDNAPARDMLGIAFTPPAESIAATVRALNA